MNLTPEFDGICLAFILIEAFVELFSFLHLEDEIDCFSSSGQILILRSGATYFETFSDVFNRVMFMSFLVFDV